MVTTRGSLFMVASLAAGFGLLVGLTLPPSRAVEDSVYSEATGDARGPALTMITGQLKGSPGSDALYVLRQSDQKLAVYMLSGSTLELRYMRPLSFDFDVGDAFSKSGHTQTPTSEEMRKRKP